MKQCCIFLFGLFALFAAPIEAQEVIAVIREPNVVLLSPQDGSVIDPSFIDLTPLNQGQPKALTQVGDQIWIADQTEDRIDRFDLDGNYLSTIDTGLDNVKGLGVIQDEVWVTNAGANNGAPGASLVRFDLQGNALGHFATTGSSFDVLNTGDEIYVSYIGSETRIERRDAQGNVLGDLVPTGLVTFIQQMSLAQDANTVFAAVFSNNGANTAGLYEFSRTDGSLVDFWQEGSLRGVMPLDNGQILLSAGTNYGVKILDPVSGNTTQLWAESSQYFAKLNLSPCTAPPTPVGPANQTFNSGATIEDIEVDPIDVIWFATESDALSNINPLAAGTELVDATTYYAIQVVDGCASAPLAVTITINVLEIGQWEKGSIILAPNPGIDLTRFTSETPIRQIVVFNHLGQRVYASLMNDRMGEVSLNGWPVGVYFIRFTDQAGRRQTIQLLKH